MANIKLVKMKIYTGYAGATHEDEFELDVEGMTEQEIESAIEEELDIFIQNEISANYEIEDI